MVANGLARRSGDRRGGKAFCSVVPSSSMFAESGEAESLRERRASERVRRGVRGVGRRKEGSANNEGATDGRGRSDGDPPPSLPRSSVPLDPAWRLTAVRSGGERSCGEYIKCFATKEGDSVAKMGRVTRGRG